MFDVDLRLYGPEARPTDPPTPAEARRYCRRLAQGHYENFTVASWLLPRQLRQPMANVYAYCRWADDLADEAGDAARSLELLDWWQGQLDACYAGQSRHPVFVALAETIRRYALPRGPLDELLVAFRQDQHQTRYESMSELLGYCRYSANPVGHLVLYLGECFSAETARLSDSVCTGLQLANFCQDIARDYAMGRIYVPQAHCRRHGYSEDDFAAARANSAFRELLATEVAQADALLRSGLPLVDMVPPGLRLAVALFIHGGLATLAEIRRQQFDVWTRRPTVSRMRKMRILANCWWRLRRGTPIGGSP